MTIWDVASSKEILRLNENNGSVFGVAYSPDGTELGVTGAKPVGLLH